MNALLGERLAGALRLTGDLALHLPAESLRLALPGLPSNTIGEQFWCVVGARESHLRAIREGGWKGFACSLADPADREELLDKLEASRAAIEGLPFADFPPGQAEFAWRLLEHEILHHGQLIRYVYGNRLAFPASWNARYTV